MGFVPPFALVKQGSVRAREPWGREEGGGRGRWGRRARPPFCQDLGHHEATRAPPLRRDLDREAFTRVLRQRLVALRRGGLAEQRLGATGSGDLGDAIGWGALSRGPWADSWAHPHPCGALSAAAAALGKGNSLEGAAETGCAPATPSCPRNAGPSSGEAFFF